MSNTYEAIIAERRGSGVWLTLNRPQGMNAISSKMLDEIEMVANEAKQDDSVAAIVFTGNEKAFCAGADLKEILNSLHDDTPGRKDVLERISEVFHLLRNYPKPVIAAVSGLALAGGLELVMCCDIVFASDTAKMGDAHSNFGITPGAGGAAVLPRKIGLNRAKYLMFTGDFITAEEMERYGLVNKVFPAGMLAEETEAFVERLAGKSPLVLRKMKEIANASLDKDQDSSLQEELLCLRHHTRSYDLNEGLAAFSGKRKPEFKGY